MKYKKPGRPKKHKPKLKPPNNKYCRNCNKTTGTERWCHAESRIIKFEHGGGIMGGKIPDDQTAWLCFNCDNILSKPIYKDSAQVEFEKHATIWREIIRLSHN